MGQKQVHAEDNGPCEAPAGAQEHGHAAAARSKGWGLVALSFSALGIIYGDIGTSPLYAYQAVFSAAPQQQEVLAAASLFFWTLTLIVLLKYVGIIIRFDDNGEGGTFALYSLMCRAAGFTPFGPAQPEELQLSGLPAGLWGHWWSLANDKSVGLRRAYMRSRGLQVALLFVVMTATAMVVGDGVLTPSISVLSAVSGLHIAIPSLQQGEVIGVTIVVLVVLFSVQYMGTSKIAAAFAPIITVWLLLNAGIGLTNLSRFGWTAWQAVSPHHAISAFTGPDGFASGWRLLAGVMLAITGAEAMYADLGHFNARAVMLSFCAMVYPCLVLTYMGQAAYLMAHPEAYTDPFWHSVPKALFWPMLVVATAASVVASQALISGVFSIMRQAMNLGVFPPMKVTNTDEVAEGQIYIGSINFMLMLGCIAMVAGFQDTTALGHAYGVAVMSVMFLTTILAGIVMLVCYGINPLLVAAFVGFFVPLEGLFLSSNIIKIPEGGWVTIMIAAFVASINLVWWYGSGAKARWFKAQADRNRGLLAHLSLQKLTEEDAEGPDGQQDTQPLVPPAPAAAGVHRRMRQAGGTTSGAAAAQWTPEAAVHEAGSSALIAPEGAPAGDGQHQLPAKRLKSSSTPVSKGFTAAAGGSDGGTSGPVAGAAAAAVRGHLVAQSWTAGVPRGRRYAGASSGGAMVFDSRPLARLPGLGIIYTQATSGIPAVLQHLLVNMPALHEVTVLLTVRIIPRPYASQEERFLVRRSKSLAGIFRVIVRYGYMEAVDHGPLFVKQLLSCLMRYAASTHPQQQHQQHQQKQPQQQQVPAGAGTSPRGAATVASPFKHASTARAVAAPGDSSDTAGAPQVAAADACRAARVLSGRPSLGLDSGAVVIELQPVDELQAGAVAGLQGGDAGGSKGRSLARWSRVLVSPADSEILEEVAAAGPNLAARSFQPSVLSPRASLELPPAHASTPSSPNSSRQVPSVLLGRESLNRQQYSLQKVLVRKQQQSRAGSGATGAVDSSVAVTLGQLQPGMQAAAVGGAGTSAYDAAGAKAVEAAAAGGTGGVGQLSEAQLCEVQLLLRCLQQRTVYIMGRTQLVSAQCEGACTPKGFRSLGRAVGMYCRSVVTGAYRVLANNTHPSSASWQLPDDQLVLVSMVVRV